MSTFRTILAALDDSPRAPGVLRIASEMADRFDARLVVLRAVLVDPEFPPASRASHADPLEPFLVERARRELDDLARHHERARREPPIVATGDPVRAILEWSERLDVDLVVVGSHGYQGLDRLLGTTAGGVANRAHRHVLVVHERAT